MENAGGIDFDSKVLRRLVDIARALRDKPTSSFLHFSFLLDKSKILSCGWNNVTCSGVRINKRYYYYPLGGEHSEASALKKYRGDYGGVKMVNIRLNNQGELRYSRPCNLCYTILKNCGIRRLYYSTNTHFEFERL